jgi:hypothetical protein
VLHRINSVKRYRNEILLVLYGCETWFHLREQLKVKVFENRVLRNICELNSEEVSGVV